MPIKTAGRHRRHPPTVIANRVQLSASGVVGVREQISKFRIPLHGQGLTELIVVDHGSLLSAPSTKLASLRNCAAMSLLVIVAFDDT